jgi:hypothetical protein
VNQVSANSSMAMLLALKRCPRCGHFDRGVADHNKRTLVAAEVIAGVLLATAALCLFLIPMSRVAFLIGAGIALVGFIAQLVLLIRRYPLDSESRVVLIEAMPGDNRWFR